MPRTNGCQEPDLSKLNDEEYLASRSRMARTNDCSIAKSWLITSCLLYPNNFTILFEAYMFEKHRKNVSEAAKLLKRLYIHFSKDDALWEEMENIFERVQSDDPSEDILLDIYGQLPKDIQMRIPIALANRAPNAYKRTQITLTAFEKFPDLLINHGSEALGFLIEQCNEALSLNLKDPKNFEQADTLLQMLVLELAPKCLQERQLSLSFLLLEDLLTLTLTYLSMIDFTLYMSGSPLHLVDSAEGEGSLPELWQTIFGNLEDVGERMGWGLTENLFEEVTLYNPESILKKIVAFQQMNPWTGGPVLSAHYGQFYYVVSTLFLKGFTEYLVERVGGAKNSRSPSILVEAFISHEDDNQPDAKRRKTSEENANLPLVTDGYQMDKKPIVVKGFLTAVAYMNIIRDNPELDSKFQKSKPILGDSILYFLVDALFYQERYKESLQLLRQLPSPLVRASKCRLQLKLASRYLCLGDYQSVADCVIQAVNCLSQPTNQDEDEVQVLEDSVCPPDAENPEEARIGKVLRKSTACSRHLHFLMPNKQSILAYCTRLLIHILKAGSLKPSLTRSDFAIGHVIVLLQYSFPEEKDLLFTLLNKIRCKESFSYHVFCDYVINVDFLEEFAYLLTETNGNVALDITPALPSNRRMGTRGANRGEKHDIQQALRKQVSKCYQNIDQLMIDFLVKQRSSIFQSVS